MLGAAGKKTQKEIHKIFEYAKRCSAIFFCYVFHSTLFNEYESTRKHYKDKPELIFKKTCLSARGGFQT
jgi:hypothetical protein